MYDFDLFVIGAGSGGVAGSRRAASYGARVGICEEWTVGGTCVNRGCIPKKLYVYASHFRDDVEDAASYGWARIDPSFDWSKLVAAKRQELSRLRGIYERLLADAGVRFLEGRGVLEGTHAVRVADQQYTAENIVIATGARPHLPDIPGIEHAISSDDAFDLPELPRRIAIVGGGYIAVEFAGIFHGLGSEIIQLYRRDLFLRGFDDDVRRALAEEMRRKGIDLRFNSNVTAIEKRGERVCATTTDGDVLEVDQVMFATGRLPNSSGFGLPEAGVEVNAKGAIAVDGVVAHEGPEHLRDRRRDRSREPDAGRDPRGAGARRDALRRKSHAAGPREGPERRLQPAADRHRGAQRGAGARALRRGRRLPHTIPTAETDAHRAG